MPERVLKLDSSDNVLIALSDLNQGEQIRAGEETYQLISTVPAKHKFATADLAIGDDVIMYGVVVGAAMKSVQRGEVQTKAELKGQADFIPWKRGVSL